MANYCHCADCRKITGSAFNVGIRFEKINFTLLSGEIKRFTKNGESGRFITRAFCPDCGSPIFTESEAHPELLYIKAGSLDQPAIVRPAYEIYNESKVAWSQIPTGIKSYPRGSGL